MLKVFCKTFGPNWTEWNIVESTNRYTVSRWCDRCGKEESYSVVDHVCPECGNPTAVKSGWENPTWRCRKCAPQARRSDTYSLKAHLSEII